MPVRGEQFRSAVRIPAGIRLKDHHGLRINFVRGHPIELGVEGVITAAGRIRGGAFENLF